MLEGASGLGSQVSICLGPPCRKSMITDLAAPKGLPGVSVFASAAEAFQARNSGRLRPIRLAPPTRNSSRREKPSQVLPVRPGIETMSELYAFREQTAATKFDCHMMRFSLC